MFERAFRKTEIQVVTANMSQDAISVERNMSRLLAEQCPKAARSESTFMATIEQLRTAKSQIEKYQSRAQYPVCTVPLS